jgi:hypothetical protein
VAMYFSGRSEGVSLMSVARGKKSKGGWGFDLICSLQFIVTQDHVLLKTRSFFLVKLRSCKHQASWRWYEAQRHHAPA